MYKLSGIIPSPLSNLDYNVSRIAIPVSLPPSVRLDNQLLSIRDQWVFPTCVGKASAGIMSASLKEEISSIYIYSKCKEIDGIPDVPGTYLKTACQVMLHNGSCTSRLLPYSSMTEPVPKMQAIHDAEAASRKIAMYARAGGLRDIKQALANGYMLTGCMLIGDNFMYHRNDDTIGQPTGSLYGYHAVIVCGYDDARQALRIANSWGDNRWGENGFAWVSYSVLNYLLHWPESWVVDVVKKQEEPIKPKTAEDFYPDRIFRDLRRYLKKKLLGGNKMFYTKEAFWAAVLAVVVPILNHFFEWGLEVGTIAVIIVPLLALIIGDKWESAKIAEAEAMVNIAAIHAGLYDIEE